MEFSTVRDLYFKWIHEDNPFLKNDRLKELKEKVSPYEFLKYSSYTNITIPFARFREVFGISELFGAIGEMQQKGEDIKELLKSPIVARNKKDVEDINTFLRRNTKIDTKQMSCVFASDDVFKYGNIDDICSKFSSVKTLELNVNNIKNLLKLSKTSKGIPISSLHINHISELSLEELRQIENSFDIGEIHFLNKKDNRGQGEAVPMTLETYKQLREKIDNIVNKLYIREDSSVRNNQLFLTTQIINEVVRTIEYDYDAVKEDHTSKQISSASGLLGLIIGKTICLGYSNILNELLHCVNVPCNIVVGNAQDGIIMNERDNHAWNQVKIENEWYNMDITFARKCILEGRESGDLFMSDKAFYTNRKRDCLENNGPVVMLGGHTTKAKCNTCERYMNPSTILKFLELAQKFNEMTRSDIPIPSPFVSYVGSEFQKNIIQNNEINNQDEI